MSWRPDITGRPSAGNVCPECVKAHEARKIVGRPVITETDRPMNLFDYCRQESGLTEPEAIRRYMNRHYGHG
jgi:hypothetical protein